MVDLIDATTREDAIGQRVRAWAMLATGLPDGKVIFAFPDAPRPANPYCMVNLINSQCVRETGPVVYEEVEEGEGEGGEGEEELPRFVQRRAEDWEWTYSVHLYGSDAQDRAQRMMSSLNNATVRIEKFSPLVVREPSFGRRGLIRRIPEQVNNAWEMRANFDLVVAGIVLDGFLIDIIERGHIALASRMGSVDFEAEFPIGG